MSTVFNWEHIFGSCWKSASQRFFHTMLNGNFKLGIASAYCWQLSKMPASVTWPSVWSTWSTTVFSANGKVGYISRHVGHIWSQPMAKENIFHLSVTRHTATWALPCQVYLLIIILIIILAISQCIQWKDSQNRGNFISKYCQKIPNSCKEKLWEKNCKSQHMSKMYSCIR